jgi:hypothetical protein
MHKIKLIIVLIPILCISCGRLDQYVEESNDKQYTISKYVNGLYVGGWDSTTTVYLKFENKFIEAEGEFKIEAQ